MSGRPSRMRAWAAVLGLLVVLLLAGCQVSTSVEVQVAAGGSGSVLVTVGFDRAASAAVGGVAAQLRTGDLEAAGWRIATRAASDGATVVTLVHSFARLSQLPGILGEVARAHGVGGPLFRLHVTQATTSSGVRTTAEGAVDLSCGVACFGDAGLASAYGSEVGVDAGALEGRRGAAMAARDLPFRLTLSLPGRVTASNSPTGRDQLLWTPVIGRRTSVSASAATLTVRRGSTSATGGGRVVVVSALLALGVVLAAVVAVRIGVRRRARGTGSHRRGRTPGL